MSFGSSGTNVKSIRAMRRSVRATRTCRWATSRRALCHLSSTPFTPLHMHLTTSLNRSAASTVATAGNHLCQLLEQKCCGSFIMCRSRAHRERKFGLTRTAMLTVITTSTSTRRTTQSLITCRLGRGERGGQIVIAFLLTSSIKKFPISLAVWTLTFSHWSGRVANRSQSAVNPAPLALSATSKTSAAGFASSAISTLTPRTTPVCRAAPGGDPMSTSPDVTKSQLKLSTGSRLGLSSRSCSRRLVSASPSSRHVFSSGNGSCVCVCLRSDG